MKMKNVEYKNMVASTASNGANYLESPVGVLNVGDVVTRTIVPTARELQRSRRGTPKITIETFVVTGLGGEFYSKILECEAVRAYCEKTTEFKAM
jgi:hypothetical protein